ncbi:MAG: ROK family protein [Endomicrobiaceae bacterium]
MSKFYLGIDMGGTSIKIAVVNDKADIIEESALDTDIKAKPEKVIVDIVNACKKLKFYNKVKSIGLGIAGDVDFKNGIVRFSPNLPKWKNVKLKKELEKITKKIVFVDNDANTACIGAYWLDLKAKSDNMICVTLGTGVGGGIIIDKKLYRGNTGTAGEIGHMTLELNGNKCNCGNFGCAEAYIGAKYLVRQAVELMKTQKSEYILQLADYDESKITPRILSVAAAKGDSVAKHIWLCAGQKLGILLANIINFINPDSIVLCGGISKSGKELLKYANKEIKLRAFNTAADSCKIIISKYTSKLGVVGAAMLIKN